MARSLNLLVLLVALSAVQVPASVVREEAIARLIPEGRAAATVFTTTTTTAPGTFTTTLTTKLVCAVLKDPLITTVCRRKRQFWNAPIFLALGQPESYDQFQQLNPSQVLRVEPSVLPEYRNRPAYMRPFVSSYASPYAIQSSFEKPVQTNLPVSVRVADPFFGLRLTAFSSLFSNIISSILTPAVTSTTTKTVFSATSTITSFSPTVKFSLENPVCIPAGVTVCPP